MASVAVRNLWKRFGDTEALADVTLDLADGSFTALLGPSGCGKTTLLRVLAGFEAPSAGEVRFGEATVSTPGSVVPPEDRGVAIVFQSYALWPHLSVVENVAYPLRSRRVARADILPRARAALAAVGLAGFEARNVDELSGGQRQRVALARCLVADAHLTLFDEPLANLDVHLRAAMVEEFRRLHRETGRTVVYVTHDQSEALAMADRVVVLEGGRVQQAASPAELYRAPANAMVAGFVGRGGLVAGTATGRDGAGRVTVRIGDDTVAARAPDGLKPGPVTLCLRPEQLSPAECGIAATVTRATYRGPSWEVELAVGEGRALVDLAQAPAIGAPLRLKVADAWALPG